MRREGIARSARGIGVFIPCILVFWGALGLMAAFPANAVASGWIQVNDDGFVPGNQMSDTGSSLLVFKHSVYAQSDLGLFRLDDPASRKWTKIRTPVFLASYPGVEAGLVRQRVRYQYAQGKGETLYCGLTSADLENASNWKEVTSYLNGGLRPSRAIANLKPLGMFKGRLYAVQVPGTGGFRVYRTGDIGKIEAVWDLVTDSFGDPAGNTGLSMFIAFGSSLYIGTDSLPGSCVFGDPKCYGSGVKIWESETGDPGTWQQVNKNGFGILAPCCGANQNCNFAIHQVIGSAAVYKPPGQVEYLFVGTLSHFGGEIWRYDGTGAGGWSNVSPEWMGPCPCVGIGCGPGRYHALAVFKNELYATEGFPTANLSKYDGVNWSVVEPGPNPFDPHNGGLTGLAEWQDSLYVSTRATGTGTNQGDQVWAWPLTAP